MWVVHGSRILFAIGWLTLSASALGQDLTGTIDFEGSPAGTVVTTQFAASAQGPVGPILVSGFNPNLPAENAALIFDSANPTGDDLDLGTPHEDFGGPGVGPGGAAGSQFENAEPLGNLLIIAEDLVDSNNDGLVDDPDDAALDGMIFTFDFSTLNSPFTPVDIRVLELKTIDGEDSESPGFARFFDAAGSLIDEIELEATGCNGVGTHVFGPLGVSGVMSLEVEINGSGAIDDIVFVLESAPGPICQIDPSGPFEVEVGEELTFDVNASTSAPGGSVTLSSMGPLPTDVLFDPPLPLTSAASTQSTSLTWTPGTEDIGLTVFTFLVEDNQGQETLCEAVVEVTCDFEITAQPVGLSVCAGQPIVLSVEAEGTGVLTYQWRFNGNPIPGANAPLFEIASSSPGDVGNYSVEITSPCGVFTSSSATVIVDEPPQITASPQSATLCLGDPLEVTVEASSSLPLTYVWSRDGEILPEFEGPTLTIPVTQASDAGLYTVVVSNDCGEIESSGALVTLLDPPTLLESPADQTGCPGGSASFGVTASGSAPLTYQWSFGGSPISGATESTLSLTDLDPSQAGLYEVLVENACGSFTASALLTLLELPAALAPVDQEVCEGEIVELSATVTAGEPVSFQWFRNGALIPGARANPLILEFVTAEDAGDYEVEITNSCGSVTVGPVTVTVLTPPEITSDPDDTVACLGDPVSLFVTVSGSEPLSFEWRLAGEPVAGQTAAELFLDGTSASDAGNYEVIVSNACGEVTSSIATLTLEVCELEFLRGECNDDGRGVNIADGIFIIDYLFGVGSPPPCVAACDMNGDGILNLADAMSNFMHQLLDGPPPPEPFPACGVIEGADCAFFESCEED